MIDGPEVWMAEPDPKNSPVPIAPPIAIIWMCRLFSERDSEFVWSFVSIVSSLKMSIKNAPSTYYSTRGVLQRGSTQVPQYNMYCLLLQIRLPPLSIAILVAGFQQMPALCEYLPVYGSYFKCQPQIVNTCSQMKNKDKLNQQISWFFGQYRVSLSQ